MDSVLPRILRIIAWSFVAYVGVVLLVVLPALNILAPRLAEDYLDRELRSELIILNPFTLALDVRRTTLLERDGHQPLGFKRLHIDLSVSSLWQPGIVFDDLRLEELDLHVLRHADGHFHFDDLLTTAESDAAQSTEADLPAVTVHDVYIGAHSLRFTDRTRPGPYTARYRDFVVSTRDVTTVPGRRGDGELLLANEEGGEIRWRGEMAIADGQSAGSVTVDNLDLTHLYRYERENLSFILHAANLDLALDYRVDWSGDPAFTIADGRLRLHGTDITPADGAALPNTHLRLEEASIDGINADSATARARVDSLALRGLDLEGFDAGDTVSLADMLAGRATDPEVENQDTNSTTERSDAAAAGSWGVELGELSLDDSEVRWRSQYLTPDPLTISPLRVILRDLSWPARSPSALQVDMGLEGSANLRIDGHLHFATGAGKLDVDLRALPPAWINPTLNAYARADIKRGLLDVEASAVLDDFAPEQVSADVGLRDFAMQIHGEEDSALTIAGLAIHGARAAVPDSRISVDSILLQGWRSGLHILEDGSLNAMRALPEEAAAEATSDSQGDTEDAAAWTVKVAEIAVRDGQLDFADDSLPLPFATLIGDINADIRDIDTDADIPLSVTLNGAVDGYAPVVIEGSGRLLSEPRDGEVTFSFRGVDIATMTPYSGTYAGYAIDSGSLSLDLRYGLAGTQIDGDNRIVISQMQLGEPIESERAMQLPLKLGIALLTDAEGVIDLSVPISGAVDDPKFSLGAVIGKAIANVIIKAATAPFRLLAGLAGSDRDLENIAFSAGLAETDEAAQAALGDLAAALKERPQLQLRVIGGADPIADGSALRRSQLEGELLALGLAAESLAARDGKWQAAIEARYDALGLPPAEGEAPTIDEQLEAVIAAVALPPSAFKDLATARAAAAKRELVTAGAVDAARIAISYDAALLTAGVRMSVDS
jgi:hypothetical protein